MNKGNDFFTIFLSAVSVLLPAIVSADNNIEFLSKKVISNLRSSVYEVVAPKIESDKIKYARELPFDKLSFQERNEKYFSIGTAFFINDKQLMSAAHVFGLEDFSLYYKDISIRGSQGDVYRIKNIIKYSSVRDMVIFDLEKYPESIVPLQFSKHAEIGDTVFTVGNVQGEGISFRAGQVAAFTYEPEFGQWKDIRFTAPASPGNSGGPLVDIKGNVLGVVVKKNESENHNVAVPATEVENLGKRAEFFLRNVVLSLNDEQNNIARDWKIELQLPDNVEDLAKKAQLSLNEFYHVLGIDLDDKFKEHYFPRGKRFRAYLRNQTFIRNFGVLKSDADFNEWSIEGSATKTIPLTKNQNIIISKNKLSDFQVIIEKPSGVPLQAFISDPRLVMESMLKGVPITREVGVDRVRVESLGDPEKIDYWQDKLGRKWVSSLWFMPYLDAYVYSHCLAYPKGVICNVDLNEDSELYKGYFDLVKQNYDEIAIGYEGEVVDWLEYFSLDKKYLPKIFEKSSMSLTQNTFKLSLEDYKVSLQSNEISDKSNIHFHFGYSNYNLLAENLLLFELFPIKGAKSHYRVLKYYAPSEFSSDEYKTTWSEVENKENDYSGNLIKKNGKFTVQKVITDTVENKDDIKSVYVIRCINEAMNDNIGSNCDRFSKSVQFNKRENLITAL